MALLERIIQHDGRGWMLFNDYRYKRMAQADAKTITKYDTLILQGKSGTWYLYQSVDARLEFTAHKKGE